MTHTPRPSMYGKSKNTHSKKMRALAEKGVTILCSVAPYEGREVEYSPRAHGDREPWVLKNIETSLRYNGREVHADFPPREKEGTNGDSV